MTIIELPFDITDTDIRCGFENGQDPRYDSTKPDTDNDLVDFIQDFLHLDGGMRLKYNIGFVLGLYAKK